MKVVLEIKGDKAISILEVLKRIKGITIKSVDDKKAAYLTDLKDAYHETELDEEGKIFLKSFDDLIDEL